MRGATRSIVIAILLCAGPLCVADQELTAHLGIRFGGEVEAEALDVETLEDSPAFGLSYSRQLKGRGRLWSAWSFQPTEFDAPGFLPDSDSIDLDIHYLHLGTAFRPPSKGKTQGFVLFGAGVTWIDPGPAEFDSNLGGSLVIGGGFRRPIRPALAFRFDARGYMTFMETRLDGVCGGVGCSIDFAGNGAFQLELLGGLSFGF